MRFSEFRAKHALTQARAAELFGLSIQVVRRYDAGQRLPRPVQLLMLAIDGSPEFRRWYDDARSGLPSSAEVPVSEPARIPEKAISQPAPSDRASVLAAFVRDHLRTDPSARTHKSDVRMAWIRYPAADELDRKGADDLTDELPRMLAGVVLDGGYYIGLALVDNSACV